MADLNLELLETRVERIDKNLIELSRKIDGDPRIVNGNGAGRGLVGKVAHLESRVDRLDKITARPTGWVTLVIAGGVISLLMGIAALIMLWYLLWGLL